MLNYNKNSGYGQSIIPNLPLIGTGKIRVVGKSGVSYRQMIRDLFKTDPDGETRFYSTIDSAIGDCTANANDTIFVMPGHTETISSATSLVADVAGVQIIGLGRGTDRPILDFTNTAGSIELDAANVLLKNFTLKANVSAIVVGINVDASGCAIEDCKFTYNETGDDFKTMIDVDGVDNITLKNVEFIAEDTAGAEEAIRLDDCDNVKIVGCLFYGEFGDAVIIGEGAAGSNLLIARNYIYNSDTDAAAMTVDLNVAFTGLMTDNRIGTLHAANPEDTVDPGSLLSLENYVCNAVDESGVIVPTVIST